MSQASDLRPGVIAKVVCKSHGQFNRFAIVDGVVESWKHIGADGRIFMMPPLVSIRIADGDLTGERFGLPLDWVRVVAVPPFWAAKLRRQAYGLDQPLTPGNSPVPAKAEPAKLAPKVSA